MYVQFRYGLVISKREFSYGNKGVTRLSMQRTGRYEVKDSKVSLHYKRLLSRLKRKENYLALKALRERSWRQYEIWAARCRFDTRMTELTAWRLHVTEWSQAKLALLLPVLFFSLSLSFITFLTLFL